MRMLALLVVIAACTSSKPTATAPPQGSSGSGSVATSDAAAMESGTATTGSAASMPDAAVAAAIDAGSLDDDLGMTYTDPAGGSPGTVKANTVYRSDCSTTHPIAHDVCDGAPPDTRKLKSCKALHVKMFKPCKKGAPSCYVERTCADGRVVASDFLECAAEQSHRCFTKSSRIYKDDIAYLSEP
ncbi:MAG TPA: hypothetical protein VMZ53_22195, partial [Kofleriaceae bacterium]|nr:hypothetical protein [Kofleriaceae bacterium]